MGDYNNEIKAAISPDGKIAAYANEKEIVFWDLSRGVDLGSIPVGAKVTAVAFSRDGKVLVVGAVDSTLRFFVRSD